MEQHDDKLDALDRVVDDLKQEPTADLDWDRMERSLMAKVEAQPLPAQRFPWAGALALAAAAALAIFGWRALSPSSPASAPQASSPAAPTRVFTAATIDGATLRVGDRVEAKGHDVVVTHSGKATWTLAQGSQAEVAELGQHLTVKLTSGEVSSKVVPSPKPESFAIEVEGTRVAVHGTQFTVKRGTNRAEVAVREGVVAVGPTGHRGNTEGWLLGAGDSGSFSLDGHDGTVTRAKTAAVEPETEPDAPKPVRGAPPVAKLPERPSVNELEGALDRVSGAVTSCFARHTSEQAGVRVTARSRASLDFGADGKLIALGFDPPLAPAVEQCTRDATRKLSVSRSQSGASTTRSILLGP